MISVDVTGVENLQSDLKKYGRDAEKAINTAVAQTSLAIQTDAKTRLMGGLGGNMAHSMPKQNIKTKKQTGHGGAGLLGSIYNRVIGSMEKIVGTNKSYAPYIEFGIGDFVFKSMDFSEEAKREAAQFKGVKKVKGFETNSFLNWSAVNQEKKHLQRIETELNKIK